MADQTTTKLSDLVFPAYRKAWKSRKQNLVIGGSKGSGKSKFAALRVIMDIMENPGVSNALVIRKVFGTCRDSVYTDLLWAIDKLGVTEYWQYTVSPMQMVYKPTNQLILFRGLDDPLKLASIMVRKGLITTVWFEESFEIANYDDILKVQMSIRGEIPKDSKAFKRFIYTFNPWSEHHWLKKEFFDQERDDTLAMITTYRDNLKLGADDVARYELLKETNPHAARVICDGEWGRAEGLIYENWTEEEFDPYEILKSRNVVPAFGLDFGYSISYNAFVAVLVDVEAQELWIYDEWYTRGVSNLEIAKALTEMGYAKERIIADCAEPKSIYDLKTGIVDGRDDGTGTVVGVKYALPNIEPALKGKDSIRLGISTLQGYRMHVHTKCRNMILELSNYAWKVDKDGVYQDEPAKEWDHCLMPDTLILTDRGEVPIRDISEGDMVMTHLGYRPVTFAGLTQRDQPLWCLRLADGTELEGTWNHQIVTTKGVKYLKDISQGDEVIKWVGKKGPTIQSVNTSSMMENGGTDTLTHQKRPNAITSLDIMSDYTDMYGRSSMDQSPKDIISITSTGISGTMTYPTSSLSPLLNTTICIPTPLNCMSGEKSILRKIKTNAENGIDRKKVASGIGSMSETISGQSGTLNVNSAERSLMPKIMDRIDFAHLNARQNGAEILDSTTRFAFVQSVVRNSQSTGTVEQNVVPVPVDRVTACLRKSDVYDLTVADAHDFYANGILVLNCMDALRYAISYLFLKGHGAVVEAKGIDGATYTARSKRVVATITSTSV